MRYTSIFILFSLFGCGMDSPPKEITVVDPNQIVGYWDIVSASRNGKETMTLDDSFMDFQTSQKLVTNIFGDESVKDILWDDDIITLIDSSMSYKVESFTEDSLNLSFDLQKHAFDIVFVRNTLDQR